MRGYRLLKNLAPLKSVLPGVLYHHEAFDGTGYPFRLRGTSIPLIARIIAVADAYDAMTSDRPYRRGMPVEKAHEILTEGAGRRWDATIVAAFLSIREEAQSLSLESQGSLEQLLTAASGDDAADGESDPILSAIQRSCTI